MDTYQWAAGRALLPMYEGVLRGRKTFEYWREFEGNQWKSPEQLRNLQWRRLAALLRHAYATVPHYRAAFDALGARPEEIRTAEDFARLPILNKPDVRQYRDQLMSSAFRPEDLVKSATGGSTGEPMQFCYDRDSYQRRTAAAMRGDGWAGWQLCAPEFYIWGAQLLPQARLPRWKKQIHHAFLRRSICSSFDLSAEKITGIARQYNRTRPRVVVGYANALYEFARYVREAAITLHQPLGVVSSAEKLYGFQRELIEEVFRAPVFDRYGCREVMMIGAECDQHSGLHVTADNLYVEIVRDGRHCGTGEPGEVLITDLHNYGMPLIRYKVGDIASWRAGNCSCGRGLPLLNMVEGRTLGMISTPSGRVIAGEFFPHLFKDFAAIRAYQVLQETRSELVIRATLVRQLSESELALLRNTVARALGPDMHVHWEMSPNVVIERTRKFKPVVSRIPVRYDAGTRQ